MARTFWLAGFVPVALLSAGMSAAQQIQPASSSATTPDVITLGRSAVPLYGPWKFTVGDSPLDPQTGKPQWAEPAFDDSQWETVDLRPKAGFQGNIVGAAGLSPGWTLRGHSVYAGYAWYRIRIRVQAEPGVKLALAGPDNFDDAYQVFSNGALLGGFGRFDGKQPRYYYAQPVVLSLGAARPAKDDTVIAFRVWLSPRTLVGQADVGGFHSSPQLGTAETISDVNQLLWVGIVRQNLVWLLSGIVFSALTLVALILFLLNRGDAVYFWMGLVFLVAAVGDWETALAELTQTISVPAENWVCFVFVLPILRFAWVMMLWVWFQLERTRWLPWVAGVLALMQAIAYAGAFFFIPFLGAASSPVCFVISQIVAFVFLLIFYWMVWRGVRKLGIDGWLLLPAVVLDTSDKAAAWLPFLHLSRTYAPWGIWISTQQIVGLASAFVLCALLVRRWILSAQAQRVMALDMKQAREVQQVILPEARAVFPGLVVESEYRPAREVGGDFFQVLPNEQDGSLMIVAGDVTGKGLKAGMVVALLVGAVRTAAQYDVDPLRVLKTLNQRLLGRGDSQATCLALRIEADGSATLANAGHMAPYLNGEPVAMEGALPLGMLDGAEFSVMHFKLKDGDRLMLMSDGIAEATDANGALFGFERIVELLHSTSGVADVANAAQKFGQEDDISVISVTRTALVQTEDLVGAMA
jgi:stage II sporulation SpoE-like protein